MSDRITLPAWQKLGNFSPFVSIKFMGMNQGQILLFCPCFPLYVWVQMIVPPVHQHKWMWNKEVSKWGTKITSKTSKVIYSIFAGLMAKVMSRDSKVASACLSRHCFPIRPGKCWAIMDHFVAPCLVTSSSMRSSSDLVQAPLTKSGLSTFCHRWRHCTSVRSVKNSAIHTPSQNIFPWVSTVAVLKRKREKPN